VDLAERAGQVRSSLLVAVHGCAEPGQHRVRGYGHLPYFVGSVVLDRLRRHVDLYRQVIRGKGRQPRLEARHAVLGH
jgi:hypothetical protein